MDTRHIVADAASQQLAKQHHVIVDANNDHPRARVTVLGKRLERSKQDLRIIVAFENHNFGAATIFILLNGAGDPAFQYGNPRAGKAAICTGDVNRLPCLGANQEGVGLFLNNGETPVKPSLRYSDAAPDSSEPSDSIAPGNSPARYCCNTRLKR